MLLSHTRRTAHRALRERSRRLVLAADQTYSLFYEIAAEVLSFKRPGLLLRGLAAGALAWSSGTLLASEVRGPEVRINTTTAASQIAPAIAVDADGDYVVAWISDGTDGDNFGIFAQRFNSAGVAQGAEFQVNTLTTGNQSDPSVAIDTDGDFVIAWSSAAQDGSGLGVYAKRYNAAGVAQGSEFRVNTFITGDQTFPDVAMDDSGDFVITWQSIGQDGSTTGIFAQRYNAVGVAQGAEFQVNTFTNNAQSGPSIAMDASGDFVIAWNSYLQDGSNGGIYAQRFNASGVAQGTEFKVNDFTAGNQFSPVIAMDSDGDFVIAWTSTAQDGNGEGIFVRRYNAAGVAQDTDVQVNTFTSGQQRQHSVAMDAAGDYTVVWQSPQDGANYGIYAQRYNAAGIAEGLEFRVNTYITDTQTAPAIGMDAGGDFVVAWQSFGQDGSNYGIYAQRFHALAPTPIGPEFRVNTFTTERQRMPAVARDSSGNYVIAWASFGQDGSGFGIYAQRYNAAGMALGSEFIVNTFTTNDQSTPTVAMDADGDFVIAWMSDGQDGSSNGVYAQRYNATGLAQGGEFQVNAFSTGRQQTPDIAMDADGDFVITWASYAQDGNRDGIYAKRYNAAGAPQGLEFLVNTTTTNNQSQPSVAMDSDGDFAIAWWSYPQDGSSSGIYAQRYDSAGVAQGGELLVNTTTANLQVQPAVAMAPNGDFVIAWTSNLQDGSQLGIYAQRFNSMGAAQGGEFRVNTFTTGGQQLPTIAMDAEGGFAVAWASLNQDGANDGVYAQRFNLLGQTQGSEFRVNTYTPLDQSFPAVAMNADGDFVITWQSRNQDSSDYGVYAQIYRRNHAPADLLLSNATVAENNAANTVIGSFSTVDFDSAFDSAIYTLVAGIGDTDNASFQLIGNQLRTLAALNFETKPTYSIRVRITDAGGLTFEKAFTISVTNVNEAITDFDSYGTGVDENLAPNLYVTVFTPQDEDQNDTYIYALVTGTGSADNAAFQIVDNELRTLAPLDFETKQTYAVRVSVTDSGGFTFEKAFIIDVQDINEAPTDITLSNASVFENSAATTIVGTLSTTDQDAGNTFMYELVAGAGDTDNATFKLVGNELRTLAVFDRETKSSYSIRVRSTDSTALTFEKILTITVANVNESPVFGSASISSTVANIGQKLTFLATATDIDDIALTYQWTFSDSTTLAGPTVTKVFLTAGTFTAFVTVTDAVGATVTSGMLTIEVKAAATGGGSDSDGDNLSDDFESAAGTSEDGSTSVETYDFKGLQISLNFSAKMVNKDSIILTGSLPSDTLDFADKTAAVDIGGVIGLFELDKFGKSAKGATPSFSIKKAKKGLAAFTAAFKNSSYKSELANEGLTNAVTPKAGLTVTIPVVVGFEGVIRTENVQVIYKLTKAGGKGSAR